MARKGESPLELLGRAAIVGGLMIEALSARKYAQVIAGHINPNLSGVLVDVLSRERIPKRRDDSYILSTTDGVKPIVGIGKFFKTRLPRDIVAVNGAGFSDAFTSHDLRRTVTTRLGEALGMGGEQLIKKVLGYSDDSVTATYNRYGYGKEMRAVLEA